MNAFGALFKQRYWVIALVAGVVLVALPFVTVDKDNHFATHPPTSLLPAWAGIGLLLLSAGGFGFTVWSKHELNRNTAAGLDLTRVNEHNGAMSTTVGGCEVRVVEGRVEDYATEGETAVVLPCNEYFDDRCAGDTKSALGAYVNRVFDGQVGSFISLVKDECKNKLGPGTMQQKTGEESAESFGAGRCPLLRRPLGACPNKTASSQA
ncbi:MAG TPA: hypothetical protein VN841_30800 [Bryobacteraceae bacterium]|nr:hypothetical protein [Bryobacteraceae bacterium]